MAGKVKKLFNLEKFIFEEFLKIEEGLLSENISLQKLFIDYNANARDSLPYIKLAS